MMNRSRFLRWERMIREIVHTHKLSDLRARQLMGLLMLAKSKT